MQSKKGSAIESAINIAIGFGVALGSQLVIFPLYGVHVPITTDLAITCWFTLISFARSYFIRRIFNGLSKQGDRYESD
jgi:hypothetical protein